MKSNHLFILVCVVCIGASLILSACGDAKTSTGAQPEKCKSASDCLKAANDCYTPKCIQNVCDYKTVKKNCCGNKKKEDFEGTTVGEVGDVAGNKCTCEADYGKCNAPVTYTIGAAKPLTMKYLKSYCDDAQECVTSVPENLIETKPQLVESFKGSGYAFGITARYDNPLLVAASPINLEITLKDIDDTKVKSINITQVRAMDGTTILNAVPLRYSFTTVSDARLVDLSLADYRPKTPEELKTVTIVIEYALTPAVKSGDSYVGGPVKRDKVTFTLGTKLTLVDPTLVGGAAPQRVQTDNSLCKSPVDCAARTCQIAACSSGQCIYTPKASCCGNGIKDTNESGRIGSRCTCPADYGKCEGPSSIFDISKKLVPGKLFTNTCNSASRCVSSVISSSITSTDQTNEFRGAGFWINFILTYDVPFNTRASNLSFKATLKEIDGERVAVPILFNEVRIMDGTTVLAVLPLASSFVSVNDVQDFNVFLTQYEQVLAEESKQLTVQLDYSYTPVRVVSGAVTPDDSKRTLYTFTLNRPLPLYDATLVPAVS